MNLARKGRRHGDSNLLTSCGKDTGQSGPFAREPFRH